MELISKEALLRALYKKQDEPVSKQDGGKEAKKFFKSLMDMLPIELNILVIGGTGVGKSSTIRALFDGDNLPEIGTSAKPQTKEIKSYRIAKKLIFWDSPGLGEGDEYEDKKHEEKLVAKLREKDSDGNALIDMVLIILDAATKNLGTEAHLVKLVARNMDETDRDRILIALNKCDKAEREIYYDQANNKPGERQEKYLNEQVHILKEQLSKNGPLQGRDIDIIYYKAGFYDEATEKQEPPYNIDRLMEYIIKKIPKHKRGIAKLQEREPSYGSSTSPAGEKSKEKSWYEYVGDVIDWLWERKEMVATVAITIWELIRDKQKGDQKKNKAGKGR